MLAMNMDPSHKQENVCLSMMYLLITKICMENYGLN